MADRYCIECGCDHGRAYDPPIRCGACETSARCADEHAEAMAPLLAELADLRAKYGWLIAAHARGAEALAILPGLTAELDDLRHASPSLHAEALATAGVTDQTAMTDREIAIALLEHVTGSKHTPRTFRWVRVPLHHGSGVKAALLRAAGIDPDEEAGWNGDDECPVCGTDGAKVADAEVNDG